MMFWLAIGCLVLSLILFVSMMIKRNKIEQQAGKLKYKMVYQATYLLLFFASSAVFIFWS